MLDRRSLLVTAGTILTAPTAARASTETLRLWEGVPPGGGGPSGAIEIGRRGAVSNIAIPTIDVFVPAQPNGAAMLVAAGGGYKRIEMDKEARPAAMWLAARGITAFVLVYRLPIEGWRDGPLAPLQDAQRALRVIREQAGRYRLDTAKLGVLGFSAGGHLMGMAAVQSDVRPASAALIYPIITLEPPFDQSSTRRSLIGAHPDAASSAEWSVETHVRPGDPPVFLVQADDDPVSNPANSRIMAEACRRAGVPAELHRLASGGHGFGMGRPGTPTMEWPGWYETWLRKCLSGKSTAAVIRR